MLEKPPAQKGPCWRPRRHETICHRRHSDAPEPRLQCPCHAAATGSHHASLSLGADGDVFGTCSLRPALAACPAAARNGGIGCPGDGTASPYLADQRFHV